MLLDDNNLLVKIYDCLKDTCYIYILLVPTGFEPAKRIADDLESPSFDHLDTVP